MGSVEITHLLCQEFEVGLEIKASVGSDFSGLCEKRVSRMIPQNVDRRNRCGIMGRLRVIIMKLMTHIQLVIDSDINPS